MKSIIFSFFLVLILFIPKVSNTFHAAGLDITYECLPNGYDTIWSSSQVVINTGIWAYECSWRISDSSGDIVSRRKKWCKF